MSCLKAEKQDGFVSGMVATLVCIFVILVITFIALITPIQKLGVYYQLNNIERGALYKCEADGGLTDTTKTMIINDASKCGLDTSKLTITCNMLSDGSNTASTFGDEVDLTLSYNYTYTGYSLIGFVVGTGDAKTDTITAHSSTTAKN